MDREGYHHIPVYLWSWSGECVNCVRSSNTWSVASLVVSLSRPDILSLSLPCLSGLIRCFALHNLCDLNPTSWATSVAQLVEQLP